MIFYNILQFMNNFIGGIKPCVVSLGADQFKVPEQLKQMASYFAMFYASINFGSMISTVVTPLIR